MTTPIKLPKVGQKVRHVRGYNYEVKGIAAVDHADDIRFVVLEGIDKKNAGQLFIRPVANFFGQHASGLPRFTIE